MHIVVVDVVVGGGVVLCFWVYCVVDDDDDHDGKGSCVGYVVLWEVMMVVGMVLAFL